MVGVGKTRGGGRREGGWRCAKKSRGLEKKQGLWEKMRVGVGNPRVGGYHGRKPRAPEGPWEDPGGHGKEQGPCERDLEI